MESALLFLKENLVFAIMLVLSVIVFFKVIADLFKPSDNDE